MTQVSYECITECPWPHFASLDNGPRLRHSLLPSFLLSGDSGGKENISCPGDHDVTPSAAPPPTQKRGRPRKLSTDFSASAIPGKYCWSLGIWDLLVCFFVCDVDKEEGYLTYGKRLYVFLKLIFAQWNTFYYILLYFLLVSFLSEIKISLKSVIQLLE